MNQSALLDTMRWRHATKRFSDQPIAPDLIDTILEAARLSPSSYGFEPWGLIRLATPSLRQELLPHAWGAQGSLPTAPEFWVLTAKQGDQLHPYHGAHIDHMINDIQQRDQAASDKFRSLYHNWQTHDFHITDDAARHQWAARQAYIVLANIMTSAALLGVDSCPIEGFSLDAVTEILAAHDALDPAIDRPVVMVALGHRLTEPGPKTRRPLDEIVRVA